MARILRRASSVLPFVFAALAFAFTVVTITSRDWARQKHYDPSLDMKDWETPIYNIYRSPFQICEVTKDNPNENTTTYVLHCNTFDAFGFGKTSCETVFATQNYGAAHTGDERLCQQVHRAGNLAITSTTFITLGFTLTLLMTLVGCTSGSADSTTAADGSSDHHGRKRPFYTPYINFVLITSLSIGATCGLLSQFYGVLAFIQSQPPNGAFASGRGNVIDPTQDNASGPWIEGTALKAYLTCAWVFSAFAAGAAGAVWRLPRWEKDV
jgi:hypothetical protein